MKLTTLAAWGVTFWHVCVFMRKEVQCYSQNDPCQASPLRILKCRSIDLWLHENEPGLSNLHENGRSSCVRRSWSSKANVRKLFRGAIIPPDVRSSVLHSGIDYSSTEDLLALLSLACIVSPSQRIYAVPRAAGRGIECRKRLATGKPLLPEIHHMKFFRSDGWLPIY